MSTIRLSGSSSGYYDLTVPAVAGTNSIDLSKLPVKDSNGNLSITGDLTVDTNTLYVDSSNNRVGIGTTSMSEPLRVQADTDTDFSIASAVTNTALTLKNSTSGANNPVSIALTKVFPLLG